MGKTGAKHHFHTKKKLVNPVEANPGPNHYAVKDVRSTVKNSASITIPKASSPSVTISPGPATYDSHRKIVDNNWKGGIKIFSQKRLSEFAAKQIYESKRPGPANYEKRNLTGMKS